MTAKIIKILPKASWVGTPGEVKCVIAHREELMHKLPIMSDEITRLDIWLLEQPKIPIKTSIEIWSRFMYCNWLFYGDAHPELKHLMLLRLRDHFQEFQKLPPRAQEVLWPMWEMWRLQLIEENEEAEAANG